MADVEPLLEALTARLRPLEIDANQAWWLASTAVSDEHERRRVAADIALRDALADVSVFGQIRDALALGDDHDPLVRRQLEVLHDRTLPQQIPSDLRAEMTELEAEVDGTFNAFRGEINGEPVDDNTISLILRTSDDSAERRDAWEASKQVGAAVAERVQELARLRNRAARHLGHRDHFALALATSELDETRLFQTLDEVDRTTDGAFAEWKAELDSVLARRFDCPVERLAPWHYDDPFFQEPPIAGSVDLDRWLEPTDLEALTVRTYDGLGLDVRSVAERSDLLPRPGKSQHAFCIDVDHEGDVRVLSNNRPSEYWTGTMLHEFGHALYDINVDRDLPWLLRSMHPLTTEGVAMLFGRLVRDVEWLGTVAGVSDADLEDLAPRLAVARRVQLLTFARWVLVMTHFERGFYADPEGDHTTRWWELVSRFQHLQRPPGRDAPDWASKIHVALAPVYYQNYLYGELVASQLQATLHERAGGIVDRPAAGAFLVDELFAPGLSLRWDALVERATGEPLTARHLAADLERR
ncbi:MAG: M2 family metallopeptidase [Acidimicrobiia bacterium]